jgi:hypothetical protein
MDRNLDYQKGYGVFKLPETFYGNTKCELLWIRETGKARDFPTYTSYMHKEDFTKDQRKILEYDEYFIYFATYVYINNLHKRCKLMKYIPFWNSSIIDSREQQYQNIKIKSHMILKIIFIECFT